jgi:hypothetical protein
MIKFKGLYVPTASQFLSFSSINISYLYCKVVVVWIYGCMHWHSFSPLDPLMSGIPLFCVQSRDSTTATAVKNGIHIAKVKLHNDTQ